MNTPFRLERSLIRVAGPDALDFLQNLLTQDLSGLASARTLYGALLSPQGKLIADMLLWAEQDGAILIDANPARAADLLRRLSMYKLRANATLEDVSAERAILFSESQFEGAAADPRHPGLGWRRAGDAADAAGLADGAEAYQHTRLDVGAPDLARDAAPEEVFALEALLEELNGVAFGKGCFIGQENVSRMKRRATTRKKFCPIAFDGPAPAYGASVRAGEAEIGSVRTGDEGRALALLRLDRAFEALDAGWPLTVDGREIRLNPPDWLILPPREAAHG